ncbi:hypothetical protein [Luxibacter massiliensis]|uniref:hypothetical protein n=1 Tax=Luxibacter massiliensis TaxID=2219695 RepID=UPI000F052C7E|nr:hypothetical protein [Luxibacter massiliensis]
MNKKRVLWILIDLIFLIVFNVVFFVAGGTNHPASVWISYGFIHFAYIMLLVTPLLVRKSTNTAVLGFSLYSISSTYFIVAFVVGLIFVFTKPESYKLALIIQVIIAGIYAIMLISHMIANESTADSVARHEMELRYVKDASAHLKGIMDSIPEKKLRKKVESLYDLLHSSPAKSNNSVREYELSVLDLIDTLEGNLDKNDIAAAEETIKKIERAASERNRRLMY